MIKKKLSAILVFVLLCVCLSGCTKCVSTETSTVEVIVKDEHYVPQRDTPISCGETIMLMSEPAEYKIIVEYSGKEYSIDDLETYYRYKDRIGETVNGKLVTKTYDDGTEKYYIISLE